MLAGDERIVDNAKTVSFIRDLNWPGTKISEHPNSRHSLEFEVESETYLTKLVSFIGELNP